MKFFISCSEIFVEKKKKIQQTFCSIISKKNDRFVCFFEKRNDWFIWNRSFVDLDDQFLYFLKKFRCFFHSFAMNDFQNRFDDAFFTCFDFFSIFLNLSKIFFSNDTLLKNLSNAICSCSYFEIFFVKIWNDSKRNDEFKNKQKNDVDDDFVQKWNENV